MVLLHQGHDNAEFMFMFVNCHINPLTCNLQLGENKIRVCSQSYLSWGVSLGKDYYFWTSASEAFLKMMTFRWTSKI